MELNAEALSAIIIAFGTSIGTIVYSARKKDTPSEGQATVLAGTILSDGKVLKEVIDGIDALKDELKEGREQRHRDTTETVDALDRHARALRDNTEEVRQNSVALRNSGSTPEALAMMRRLIGGPQ